MTLTFALSASYNIYVRGTETPFPFNHSPILYAHTKSNKQGAEVPLYIDCTY